MAMEVGGIEELPLSYPHPPPHSTPPPTPTWRYEVFLSFRGQDTRYNFTDHLYAGLVERRIKAYRDDKNLEKGCCITKTLLRAIERSRTSIIVFSKNYAASKWCLDELVKIVKCNKLLGHMIFPVFYDVRPYHVAEQTGPYKKIFRDHDKNFKKRRVDKWRNALKTVCGISGWDKPNDMSESKLIRVIGKKILYKLKKAGPSVDKQLHQLKSKLEEMKLKFYEECEEIGTIKFCSLQWDRKIWDSTRESNLRRKKLQNNKQVHVIVHEVDKLEQLVFFARKQDWFGPGSRIIISVGNLNENMMNVLHINIDGQTNRDKKLFLDIICFFEEMNDDNVMRIRKLLLDCGFLGKVGMKVLIDEFTITISDTDNLLLREHRRLNVLEIDYGVLPLKANPTKVPQIEVQDSEKSSKPDINPQKENFSQKKIEKEPTPPGREIGLAPDKNLQSIERRQEILVPNRFVKTEKVEEEVEATPLPSGTLSLQEQKEALREYFNMSLESIHQANAFDVIEKVASNLMHNVPNLSAKASLENVISRLVEFKEIVPVAKTEAETTQAQRTSLLEKSRMLNSSLVQKQEEINSLKDKVCSLSEQVEKLEIEIQQLNDKKEQLQEDKKSAEHELENTSKMVSENLKTQEKMEEDVKKANSDWYKSKEKLALANASWKLFKECVEL
ncbi:hypothetical protein JCGZ_18744 [Jatropha curcas]|uniref:TIR domain-containing protein n=1 Tax=Jatropha curcas TaxID=180498 RepID=A0A067K1G5_JATCU|nr:uncharacterized protein LOC105641430 [Jatropha curcas]KDP29977.1 hypothetical protein JCGZ_18744 [Jatropha curcas]